MLLRLLVAFVFLTASAGAAPHDPWSKTDSGEHSIRALGSDFWVEVPVRKAEGARVVLFNHGLAQRLGLDLSGGSEALEKRILQHFAWVIAKEGESFEKSFLATRYQDSGSKKAGEALGDGRAFWMGELKIPMENGKTLYVDITSKGVGQTPLAWLNHSDPLHKDGLQSMEEAVHSFAMSEVNLRNGLDTVGDLAVIELPFLKLDKNTKQTAKAALTIRVGNQTRIAHYRYFSDDPAQFKKIFEYCVRRDLGLPLNTQIRPGHVDLYIERFAKNIGEEAARYYDLHAVHASPTSGNRTTLGSTIDLGTFRYLDAHHGEYSYLFDQLELGGQTHQLRNYVDDIFNYARRANYPLSETAATARFNRAFINELTSLWLRRIGLGDAEISRLSPSVRAKFFDTVKRMNETLGTKNVALGGSRIAKAAAYEPRNILKNAVHWQTSSPTEWEKLFQSERPWAKPDPNLLRSHAREFGLAMNSVFEELHPTSEQIRKMEERANTLGAQERLVSGRAFYENFEKPTLEAIRANKSGEEALSTLWKGVDSLVDLGLAPRPTAHLGHSPRVAVFSGTFDPPHLGHQEFVTRVMEAYGIDRLYIIPNPTSEHKVGVSPYDLRKKMTIDTFANFKNVTVADSDLEQAFRRNDMAGVLGAIHERHPTSELLQIMGDDSFQRFRSSPTANPWVTGVIVNPRTNGVDLPAMVHDVPVLNMERVEVYKTSSTLIRNRIAHKDLRGVANVVHPKVLKLIGEEGLYRAPKVRPCLDLFGMEPALIY